MVQVSLRFTSCHFQFFPQINHFYYFTFLHGLQDVENDCAQLRDNESKTDRKIPYFRFPHVLFLIGEHEITKQKKYLLGGIQKKDTKTSTKRHELNGMTQNGLFDIFTNAHG